MSLEAGTRLGSYEIVALLGAGGMGQVYRAKDSRLKREVALKVLPADVAGDRERLARFQREAEVLASLNHPNIAQIHGFEADALVMELVEGEELAVDALCRDGRTLIASAKTREAFRAGLAMEFRIIDRPDLLGYSRALVEAIGLDHLVNVQFLGDRLLEINPRISTLIYQPDLNLPWLAVKRALGELTDDEVAAHDPHTRIGRRVTRYYEQTEYEDPATRGSDRPPGRP